MRASEMTWYEYRDRIKESVIFLPVGSTEQHGPHLPLGVDVILPTRLAELTAEKMDGIVLPTIPYGYKSQPGSGGGQLFPGTTSLNGNTLVNVVLDVLLETYRHGGRKFVLFNGHYENTMFLTEAADLFVRGAKDAQVIMMDWTMLLSQDIMDEMFAETGFPGWDIEHAAITETSLMLYFAPELVRKDKIAKDGFEEKPTYAIFPPEMKDIPKSGVLFDPTSASLEKGKKLVIHVVPGLVALIRKVYG